MKIQNIESFEGMTRKQVIPMYADMIIEDHQVGSPMLNPYVKSVNEKIIARWSMSGLLYIKDHAWKLVNKRIREANDHCKSKQDGICSLPKGSCSQCK